MYRRASDDQGLHLNIKPSKPLATSNRNNDTTRKHLRKHGRAARRRGGQPRRALLQLPWSAGSSRQTFIKVRLSDSRWTGWRLRKRKHDTQQQHD